MFKIKSTFNAKGDQPQAIKKLVQGINKKYTLQTLLGVTGSGKTYTAAKIIEEIQKPVLVIAHNKTLAAQLCNEFKQFFPDNAVEFFISYYDYYQPEAYLPANDLYIEKDSSINEEIDRLRHSTTQSLLTRKDVIVVASVSCIYNLGSPVSYVEVCIAIKQNQQLDIFNLLRQLVKLSYERNDVELKRGTFRKKGNILEIFLPNQNIIIQINFSGDTIEKIFIKDALTNEIKQELKEILIFPASHFVTLPASVETAKKNIKKDMEERIQLFKSQEKLLEAQRIEQRTKFDIEMIEQLGYCSGIENYSRYFDGRQAGDPPSTLIDYFPEDFLIFIDESHATLPQIRGMYEGDFSRKKTLVEFGFRLPSAFDNRPLKFVEFEKKIKQAIFISATPGPYELQNSRQIVEQIIRPTGLVDPQVIIKKAETQINDVLEEIKKVVQKNGRVLITTLTKKMAEDLTNFLIEQKIKARYLHSEIQSLDRIGILQDLRLGKFDVLVGINLLREGLDLPEVQLVAILNADKEGFLRSQTSLIQTIGRAARNIEGRVILYADVMTKSLENAVSETTRRRNIQIAYNKKHNIIPQTIIKDIQDFIKDFNITRVSEENTNYETKIYAEEFIRSEELERYLDKLEKEMWTASKKLKFEKAAEIRDEIRTAKKNHTKKVR